MQEETLLHPESEADVEAAVAHAIETGEPLEIRGGGTKRFIGRAMQTSRVIDLSKLSGITLYEPSEMVIAAKAGTPLSDIEAALDEKGQQLAFEPPRYAVLLGAEAGKETIGANAACNLSGPRRIYTGAARDSLLGITAVTGKAERIKNGGRVMKNVTGYDLVKLSAGAFGTLGVLTEVTFKVLPKTEDARTLVFKGLDDERAQNGLSAALATPFEVSGAAHLPDAEGGAKTYIRLEGFASSLDYRVGELKRELRRYGTPTVLDKAETEALWASIRDVEPLHAHTGKAVWKISCAPTDGPAIVAEIKESVTAKCFYDWGGGLVWLALDQGNDAAAGTVRAAVTARGGHATLIRANEPIRAAIDVFEPLSDPLMTLTKSTKDVFDPHRLLNPGRMYAGV